MSPHLGWLRRFEQGGGVRFRITRTGMDAWREASVIANFDLDFIRTSQLDEALHRAMGGEAPAELPTKPVRLAILGSSTAAHLHASIRVAGLRRNIHISTYECDFGQYWQELIDPGSPLVAFEPTAILFALDAHHLAAGVDNGMTAPEVDAAFQEVRQRICECWRLAQEKFHCPILQQTPLNVHTALLGNNEHRLPGSKSGFISRLNVALRSLADAHGVDLLSIDERAARDGLSVWHDPRLWHRAKQEVSPVAAPIYGDLLGRVIAGKQGRSYKCLVLDLDNTLWGGVIGDDGLGGIVLGQGSALGEAYVAFQEYCRELSRRGIILAVCSKNDELNAIEPFDKHPDMVLKRGDIACFVANWGDKANNIRAIAEQLNIGLDSLVFVDDNPFERELVRQELPMVAVPEVGDDPTYYPQVIGDAGYFEGLGITQEDRERTNQYQVNRLRDELRSSATDLPAYLRGLDMKLIWRAFDQLSLSRTVQLINKTNQFNLTTRRYSEEDVLAIMGDGRCFGLQLRLVDRFGDNGIISVVIGRLQGSESEPANDLLVDTWLMSCRVLGRQVEQATFNLIADQSRKMGARRVIGEYIPTNKNGMVRDLYEKLGFTLAESVNDGRSRYIFDLARFSPIETFVELQEG